jgi:hypothetical protein
LIYINKIIIFFSLKIKKRRLIPRFRYNFAADLIQHI